MTVKPIDPQHTHRWPTRRLEQLSYQRAWVEIDQGAIAANTRQVRQILAPNCELMAVVKADAYGHGAVAIASTVLGAGATALGVATIPEGVRLREAGITAPILLLGSIHSPDEVQAIAQWQIQPSLSTPKQALICAEVLERLGQSLPVHLKLDTGMARLGAPWQTALEFLQLVHSLPALQPASLYSHFATADSPDLAPLQQQHAAFRQAIAQIRAAGLPVPKLHIANSAAALLDRSLHYDQVRVGLALYGLYPAPHLSDRLSLYPALSVKARVTHVTTLPAGQGVSYGHRYITQRETPIAVVGIGYADGVPRTLSNQIDVLYRGQRLPQIGAITMDQMMIDISAMPQLAPGDVVTLLGRSGSEQITAEDWAERANTISWEILCGFKDRLPRFAVATDWPSNQVSVRS
ncbi:alanine racemase [Synechococcus elongatus IITB7]|uniref:alanine racemase n=1 Tax=Synechococcus elongatus TaxID=32046 RepID=UPI0030D15179